MRRHHPQIHLTEIAGIVETMESWNDPRTSHGTVGSSGKPGSRPPGRMQCDSALKALTDELARCARKCRAIRDAANIQEAKHHVESFGGIETDLPDNNLPDNDKAARFVTAQARGDATRRGPYLKPLRSKVDTT